MFKSYLKTSWRNLAKDKNYTLLNILGLTIGMAVVLVIGLWVQYQFSYDRFLPQHQQVYRTMLRTDRNGVADAGYATCLPLANALKADIPEIRYVAQTDWIGQHSLIVGDKKVYIKGIFAGEDFLKIFQYPLLQGNAAQVLKDPASIVLTSSTAVALFGSEDPINKIVRIDNQHELKVTGVLADVPANATLRFSYIIPFSFYIQTQNWIKENFDNWNLNPISTFIALQPNATMAQVAPKLKTIMKKYDPDGYKDLKLEIFIQPLKDWHLYTGIKNGIISGGLIDYVRMFSIIGILVLIIACINFTNLSIAKSEKRAREVGVRKAIGSSRRHIMLQFMTESLMIASIAFLLALVFVTAILPAFNTLAAAKISIPWSNIAFWASMLSYVLFTGLLAGSRPAFHLSSFSPVNVLKGMQTGKTAALPQRVLVVVQFTCSVALIISTVIVYQQIQYARNRQTGYNVDRLIMTDASSDLDHNFTALKDELVNTGLVTSITKSTVPATDLYLWSGIDDWQGKYEGESLDVASVGISDDYFKTLGMQLLQGRNFESSNKLDSVSVILNEAAVKRMRLKDPLNQVISWNNKQKIRVIGVVKDALMLSPFSPAEPTFFVYNNTWSNSIMYRLSPNKDAAATITKISAIFNKYNPAYPFTYHFADESYEAKFKQEILVGKLSGIFAVLAIFISCLGLFGLAAYMAQKRTKEIGIRKVLGASVQQVWLLLSKEFIVLVLFSCLIASVVAFSFMNSWLQSYYYRIRIAPGVFIASTIAAIVITVITISFQAIRAALTNPVKSLRTE
ncbi:ABC transporter permease [Chitinophaga sp. CF418]|uniref:ABC transporter permease n=1 Tax=Chitinophaga sp. CF418 TaxID=1855287 RepID=UPI0009247458|nr:ABC transporter permease [Chitinophaga sp. CF418]SHM73255.1 ABC-type antimicrobial peptide transport system, permease component [Chitinophaga sp. CF418]